MVAVALRGSSSLETVNATEESPDRNWSGTPFHFAVCVKDWPGWSVTQLWLGRPTRQEKCPGNEFQTSWPLCLTSKLDGPSMT